MSQGEVEGIREWIRRIRQVLHGKAEEAERRERGEAYLRGAPADESPTVDVLFGSLILLLVVLL